ncbi:MAG TPA: peptidoglycan-binding domain-containing protein [Hypericibacter adhaerens]|uniref:peptidoglycan-binding domain-containing protein n=1 Tax=Hypericibacter adhaerens TaxID=2602016 RepID=UPI002C5E6CF5|nr:peptidoglycan-binding domain-containing protein [Hypericibacter adhaerens]HWA42152.1 peptidoglycan-binding domain-containing protein [Hypericibacter adhaerens]
MREAIDIRALQAALRDRGFYTGALDGLYGPLTRAAVAAARRRFGLPPGGPDDSLRIRLGLRPAPAVFPDIFVNLKGLTMLTFLAGYRTYLVAALMLLTGLAGVLGLDIPNFTGQAPGNLIMEALAFFFLRQGLKTDAGK